MQLLIRYLKNLCVEICYYSKVKMILVAGFFLFFFLKCPLLSPIVTLGVTKVSHF